MPKTIENSDDLLDIVDKASEYVDLAPSDKVLDIDCGDGTLLGWYTPQVRTVGIDSSTDNINKASSSGKMDMGAPGKFSVAAVESIFAAFKLPIPKFKVITAVDNFQNYSPVPFLYDCKELLHEKGVIVIQSAYPELKALDLKRAADETKLYIQGFGLSKKKVLRAYITHPSYKQEFASSNYDAKVRMYFLYNQVMVSENRDNTFSTMFKKPAQERRNEISS